MTTKEVIISIEGHQGYEGMDNDDVRLVTAGTLTEQAGTIDLRYQESELTGMEGTTTVFQIQGPASL